MPKPLPKKPGPARDAWEAQHPLWQDREKRRGLNQADEVWMKFEDEEGQERALRIPKGDMDDDAWAQLQRMEAEEAHPATDIETAARKVGSEKAVDDTKLPAASVASRAADGVVAAAERVAAKAPPPRVTPLRTGKPQIQSRTRNWEDIQREEPVQDDVVEVDLDGTKVPIALSALDPETRREVELKVGKPKIHSRTVAPDDAEVEAQLGTTSADSLDAELASRNARPADVGTTAADAPEAPSPQQPMDPLAQDIVGAARSTYAQPRSAGPRQPSISGGLAGLAGFANDAFAAAATNVTPVDPISPTDPRVAGPAPARRDPLPIVEAQPQPVQTVEAQPDRVLPNGQPLLTHEQGRWYDQSNPYGVPVGSPAGQGGPPVVTSPVQPPDGSGSFSMSLPVAGKGNAPGNTRGLDKKMQAAIDQERLAIEKVGQLESERIKKVGDLHVEAAAGQAETARKLTAARAESQAYLDNQRNAIETTMQEMRKVEQVDPNRLWSNMSTGNKILAGVAMAVGSLGVGTYAKMGIRHENEAMKIIDKAIQDDIGLQREDIANRRDAQKDTFQSQRWLYDNLRQKGMDDYGAMQAEGLLKYQAAINMAEAVAQQMGSPEALAKAQALAAGLQPKMVQFQTALAQHQDQMALQAEENALRRFAAQAKLASAKGQGGIQLKPSQTKSLIQLKNLIRRIATLRGLYKGQDVVPGATGAAGKAANFAGRVADKALGSLPLTEAGDYNAIAALARREIAKDYDESIVTVGEMEAWGPLVPNRGDTRGDIKLDDLYNRAVEKYNTTYDTLQRTGHDMGSVSGTGGGGGGYDPAEDGVEVDQ